MLFSAYSNHRRAIYCIPLKSYVCVLYSNSTSLCTKICGHPAIPHIHTKLRVVDQILNFITQRKARNAYTSNSSNMSSSWNSNNLANKTIVNEKPSIDMALSNVRLPPISVQLRDTDRTKGNDSDLPLPQASAQFRLHQSQNCKMNKSWLLRRTISQTVFLNFFQDTFRQLSSRVNTQAARSRGEKSPFVSGPTFRE